MNREVWTIVTTIGNIIEDKWFDMGRREFAKSHGVDIENGKMTVEEFINLTENAYGGEIIKKLRECVSGEC